MPKKTELSIANAEFRNGNIESAIAIYNEYLKTAEKPLRKSVRFCIELAKRRIHLNRNSDEDSTISGLASTMQLVDDIEKIRPFFDIDFYIAYNQDVAISGVDAVEHYCSFGWKQNLDPHPDFSTRAYLRSNPDVAESGINPFLHWVEYGRLEGRNGKPSVGTEESAPIAKPGLFGYSEQTYTISESVDIIVPIFNAYDDVRECLDRLQRYTSISHRVILIDDASTDSRIQKLCSEFVGKRENCVFKTNISNQGFISTVNYGFTLAKGHVVLLNTDAFVPEGWLDRLMAPILTDSSVATVTPMSNNAEIANVPFMGKPIILQPGNTDTLDKVARSFDSLRSLTEIPTGIGFCMGMSRHWLEKIPSFDTAFGRGYGEEVDWCQRVKNLGGRHLLTCSLFVEHRGGMSFGLEKSERIKANNKIVSGRYPTYDSAVQEFIKEDPAIGARLALALALIGTEDEVSIYLAHRLGGGAELWLQGVIEERKEKKLSSVVIRDGDYQDTILIEIYTLDGCLSGNVSIVELDQYIGLIKRKEVVYSCLVSSRDPLKIMDMVFPCLMSNDRLRILFHDYFPICPSYTLIGNDRKFCGLPGQTNCENCYSAIKEKTGNLIDSIEEWRREWKKWLDIASEIEVFSNASRDLVLGVWPELDEKVSTKPHKMNWLPRKVNVSKKAEGLVVLGVLGSIGYQKGAKLIQDIALSNDDRIQIIIIGEIDPAYYHPNIIVHGKFSRYQIANLAEQYSINCWLIPSIWPETFSFTTRECLSTGLPVYSYDLGGQSEALQISTTRGTRLALDMPISNIIETICNDIEKIYN